MAVADRDWQRWCRREFMAKMEASGKVSKSEKDEATKRKEDAYHRTTRRIFPRSIREDATVNESLEEAHERKLDNRIRQLEKECKYERIARQEIQQLLNEKQNNAET